MAPTTAPEDPTMFDAPPGAPPPVPRAFDALYQEEWTALVALAWSLSGSWPAAEDLVQDAFADAYRRWDHVAELDRPGAWIRRAVINRAASLHRRRGVESRGLARMGSLHLVASDGAGADRTGDAATDRVADPAFWSAVRALPDRQRACVALHHLEDRSIAEIAEILDCRPATVKVHLHRGRQALARRLAALDGPDAAGRPDPAHRADDPEDQR